MNVKIKLVFHGSLKKYNNNLPEAELEIPQETSVGEFIGRIDVPREEIVFVALNGSRSQLSQILQDGDEVKLFQMVGGG